MWWNGLPIRLVGGDENRADREVALACAARFKPVDAGAGSGATTDTENEAKAFGEWLGQADDPQDRPARRLALCIALDQPSGDRSDILHAAERLRKNLTESR
jgi:hypothetical protein